MIAVQHGAPTHAVWRGESLVIVLCRAGEDKQKQDCAEAQCDDGCAESHLLGAPPDRRGA